MSKEFKNFRNEFLKVILSIEQLANDLKNSTPLKNELKKARRKNKNLS